RLLVRHEQPHQLARAVVHLVLLYPDSIRSPRRRLRSALDHLPARPQTTFYRPFGRHGAGQFFVSPFPKVLRRFHPPLPHSAFVDFSARLGLATPRVLCRPSPITPGLEGHPLIKMSRG